MKRFAIGLLWALIMLLMPALKAQETAKQYIYLPYDYYFGISMGYLAFNVPAGWGFQTPDLKIHKSSLKIDGSTVYYEEGYGSRNSKFLFITPNGNQPVMELAVTGSYADITDSTAISSNFGQFSKVSETWPGTEKYQISNNSYILTFSILTQDEAEKKQCKEIIASAQAHDGYLSDDSYNWPETQYISYFAGDTTYYNKLGLTFVVPCDMSAQLQATQYKINERTTLLNNQTPLSSLVDGGESKFQSKAFKFQYGFYTRDAETELDDLIQIIGNRSNYSDACKEKFSYMLNGVPVTIYQFGKTVPDLRVIIPAQDYLAVFYIPNVTPENLPVIASFLASISIDEAKRAPNLKPDNSTVFSEEIVKFGTPVAWPTVTFEANAPVKGKVVACEIPEANATLFVPAVSGEMLTMPQYDDLIYNKKAKKYLINLSSKVLEGYDEFGISYSDYDETGYTNDGTPIAFGFHGFSYSENFSMQVQFVNENLSAEQCASILMEIVECSNEIQVSTGTATINGQKWYRVQVLRNSEASENDGSGTVYVTEINHHLFTIMTQYDSKKEGAQYNKMLETLLYQAKFK